MTGLSFNSIRTSGLVIAQLVERQTSIHEVVDSSPTRRYIFLKLTLYNSPCARAYMVSPPPLPSLKKTTPIMEHMWYYIIVFLLRYIGCINVIEIFLV